MNLFNKAKHTTISHGRYAGVQFILAISLIKKAKYFWPMGDRYRQVRLAVPLCMNMFLKHIIIMMAASYKK